MNNAVSTAPRAADATIPVPIVSLRELWPWALFALLLLAQVYAVAFAPDHYVHELLHDGRHLLGFPCH